MKTKKPFLLIQHDVETPPGLVSQWLLKNKIEFHHHKIFENPVLPMGDFSGLILLGGGMNVDQEAQHPWINDELQLILKYESENKRILGLCLGAQLCAKALGAWVGPHPKGWEVGWHPVEVDEGAKQFFHFHRYVFELPLGAKRIAQNSWWQNQGFQWKENILAFQFHPETELSWSDASADDPTLPEVTDFVQNSSEIKKNGRLYQAASEAWFLSKLDQFFASVDEDCEGEELKA